VAVVDGRPLPDQDVRLLAWAYDLPLAPLSLDVPVVPYGPHDCFHPVDADLFISASYFSTPGRHHLCLGPEVHLMFGCCRR
jgi:hypothetical protein